jgi:hypothetical protein
MHEETKGENKTHHPMHADKQRGKHKPHKWHIDCRSKKIRQAQLFGTHYLQPPFNPISGRSHTHLNSQVAVSYSRGRFKKSPRKEGGLPRADFGGTWKMTFPLAITMVVGKGLSSLKMGGEWREEEDEFEEEEKKWMRGDSGE